QFVVAAAKEKLRRPNSLQFSRARPSARGCATRSVARTEPRKRRGSERAGGGWGREVGGAGWGLKVGFELSFLEPFVDSSREAGHLLLKHSNVPNRDCTDKIPFNDVVECDVLAGHLDLICLSNAVFQRPHDEFRQGDSDGTALCK